jgi:hypothetical protein
MWCSGSKGPKITQSNSDFIRFIFSIINKKLGSPGIAVVGSSCGGYFRAKPENTPHIQKAHGESQRAKNWLPEINQDCLNVQHFHENFH